MTDVIDMNESDPELIALAEIVESMSNLNEEQRQRALTYLNNRFNPEV